MCAMRISFAWPKASPAAALNAAAKKHLENFMTPSDLSMMECILFGARLRLGPPADGDAGVDVMALALELHLGGRPRRERGDQVQHGGGIGHRLALDLEQHVARLDPRLVGGSAAQHAGDQRAARAAELERLGHRRRDLLDLDADPAARDAAALHDLL